MEIKVYIIKRIEEHDDYIEKVFPTLFQAQEYCKQFDGKEDEYARRIEEHNIEGLNNISNFASLAFLGMLLTPIPCMDILGKFDSEIQIKMLENSLSDNELKELAESKGETVTSVKNAVKQCKYLFNIKINDTYKNKYRRVKTR